MTKPGPKTPREHAAIVEWLAGGRDVYGVRRKIKIRCVILSSVCPMPDDILSRTDDNAGVFWEVTASIGGVGIVGRARTVDEAFRLSLDWLTRAVNP